MTTEIPEGLRLYFEMREAQRLQRIEEALGAMTRRERRLVREAAVMGYVRGSMFGQTAERGERLPLDREMLIEVLSACQSMPDLYPVISHLRSGVVPPSR